MRGNADDVFGKGVHNIGAGYPRFESKRRALDGWRRPFRANVGEDLGDIDRVLRPLFGTPVRFIDLFLHSRPLEWPVRKRIHRVKVHVVVPEKLLELVTLLGVIDQCLRRFRRQPQ